MSFDETGNHPMSLDETIRCARILVKCGIKTIK